MMRGRSWLYGAACVLVGALASGCASVRSPASDRAELLAAGFDVPVSFVLSATGPVRAGEPGGSAGTRDVAATLEHGRGVAHGVLWYIPNRISDLFDIVRARLRLGPGLAIDVRATEALDLFAGSYATVFIGIPGPRLERRFNWPVGLESRNGAELSFLDLSTGFGADPHYGIVEFGLGAQLLLIGADVGVDPWEAVDFLLGILTIDPVGDDV